MGGGGFIGDVVGGIGDAIGDVVDWTGDVIGDVGDFITENPLESLALALGGYGLYGLLGTEAAAGLTAEGLLSADAAQLAAQGLSEAQIAETLGYAGADALAAADAAQLATQGLSASQIESILAQQTLAPVSGATSPTISVKDALQGARLLSSLTGTPQPSLPPSYGQATNAPRGAVDYTELLNLLASKPQGPGLLGTQFNPQSVDISKVLASQRLNNLLG